MLFLNVDAQQSQKIYKVGRLSAGSPSDPLSKASYEAFRDGLRELGWIEGSNIVLENRWPSEPASSAVYPAAELVRLKVDVIVAVGSPLIQAAKQATSAIPIVMSGTGADPIAAGFVASLGRPGGNITGLSMLSTELSGKRLELLKETVSSLVRVASCAIQNFRRWQFSPKKRKRLQSPWDFSSKPGKCATRRKLTAPLLL